jgi:hypothetical protein
MTYGDSGNRLDECMHQALHDAFWFREVRAFVLSAGPGYRSVSNTFSEGLVEDILNVRDTNVRGTTARYIGAKAATIAPDGLALHLCISNSSTVHRTCSWLYEHAILWRDPLCLLLLVVGHVVWFMLVHILFV